MGDLVSWPSSSIFCLGATFYILSLVALTSERLRPPHRLTLSILALLGAALGMNAEVLTATALCGYCWLAMPANRFWRRWALLCYVVAAGVGGAAWWRASRLETLASLSVSKRGIMMGAWLVFTAPLRFAYSWTALPSPDFQTIIHWSAAPWILLVAALLLIRPHLRRILLLIWIPAVMLAFLIGSARAPLFGSNRYGPGVLYVDDRYYYSFLFPLVLHISLAFAGVLDRLSTSPERRRRLFLTLLSVLSVSAGIIEGRQRYLRSISYGNYQAVRRALEHGRSLVSIIESFPAAGGGGAAAKRRHDSARRDPSERRLPVIPHLLRVSSWYQRRPAVEPSSHTGGGRGRESDIRPLGCGGLVWASACMP